jgi:hypothetical protein
LLNIRRKDRVRLVTNQISLVGLAHKPMPAHWLVERAGS